MPLEDIEKMCVRVYKQVIQGLYRQTASDYTGFIRGAALLPVAEQVRSFRKAHLKGKWCSTYPSVSLSRSTAQLDFQT